MIVPFPYNIINICDTILLFVSLYTKYETTVIVLLHLIFLWYIFYTTLELFSNYFVTLYYYNISLFIYYDDISVLNSIAELYVMYVSIIVYGGASSLSLLSVTTGFVVQYL